MLGARITEASMTEGDAETAEGPFGVDACQPIVHEGWTAGADVEQRAVVVGGSDHPDGRCVVALVTEQPRHRLTDTPRTRTGRAGAQLPCTSGTAASLPKGERGLVDPCPRARSRSSWTPFLTVRGARAGAADL
jgi:hypothetical protein